MQGSRPSKAPAEPACVYLSYRERGKKSKFLGKKIESQPEIQPLYLSEALGTGLISLSATVPWGRPHPGVRLYFPLSPLVLTLLLKVKAPLGQFPPPRHCPGPS